MPAPALPSWPQPTYPSRPEPAYTVPSAQPSTPPTATALASPPVAAPAGAFPAHDWRSTLAPSSQAASPGYRAAPGPDTGTVYSGGRDLPERTSALPFALEVSGSLTGHILAQGEADERRTGWRTARVVLILLLVVAILVAVGFGVAIVAGDAVTDFFNGIIES